MSYSGSGNTGGAWRSDGGVPPHAFDPMLQPELFRGVLTRRFFAFLIDLVVLSIPVILAVVFIAVFGIVTLGLGWMLFWLVSPASIIWALVYYGASLGGPHSATIGMRIMDLEMRTCARLLCAGRHARGGVLGFGVVPDAGDCAGRAVQRPPASAARHDSRNRDYQQFCACPGRATGANLLTPTKPIDRQPPRRDAVPGCFGGLTTERDPALA
jgi:hypothetical protein